MIPHILLCGTGNDSTLRALMRRLPVAVLVISNSEPPTGEPARSLADLVASCTNFPAPDEIVVCDPPLWAAIPRLDTLRLRWWRCINRLNAAHRRWLRPPPREPG